MRDRGELSIAIERDGAHHLLRAVVADPMPPRLSAVIGDALHNVRSALDLFASALWPHRVGRALTDREEALIHFPITQNPAEFNGWFDRRPALPTLDDQAMADLRWVQPWYYDQQAATVLAREPQWPERRYHLLLRLQDLSNADKHRRLAVVAVFPDMIAAGTPADTDMQYRPGTQRPGNGVEIGRWIPPGDNPDMPIEHMGDLCLVLESDLDQALTDPVVEALGGMRQQVSIMLHQLSPLLG